MRHVKLTSALTFFSVNFFRSFLLGPWLTEKVGGQTGGMWLINNMPIIERELNESAPCTGYAADVWAAVCAAFPVALACFMAGDAAFNGAGALILHLLQPFLPSLALAECPSQARSPFLCSLNFLHNFHIKKHGQNCYDYISWLCGCVCFAACASVYMCAIS